MSKRQDSGQRIQVGVIGLATVLLLVSVVNFVFQRASDETTAIEEIQAESAESDSSFAEAEEAPAEPLADIGITPAPATEEDVIPEASGKIDPEVNKNLSNAEPVVPDLKPDPKLEAPMDREP